MMDIDRRDRPAAIALTASAMALAAAFSFQAAGYRPCDLCLTQRLPHVVAMAIGISTLLLSPIAARVEDIRPCSITVTKRVLAVLAASALFASGAIAVFHVGVEQGWWIHHAPCTVSFTSMEEMMRASVVPCDKPQWTLAGISMAGYNAMLSFAAGVATLLLQAAADGRIGRDNTKGTK